MWWPKHHSTAERCARLALTMALAALVSGCFQPLYGTRTVGGSPAVAQQLRSVEVSAVKNVSGDSPDARIAGELRNALIFELTGGAQANAPTHRLNLQISSLRQQVIIDITSGRPDVEQAGVTATFSLIELATNKTVMSGQTFSRVSYDIPGIEQRFARARGRRDAEDRAAKVIAEDIRTRLASYFIAGT